jgi:hypothetical protein
MPTLIVAIALLDESAFEVAMTWYTPVAVGAL